MSAANDALQTRDRPWRSRSSDAPLRWRARGIASGTRSATERVRTPIHLSNSVGTAALSAAA